MQLLFIHYVVDIACAVVTCVEKEEALEILSKLGATSDPLVILYLFEKAIEGGTESVLNHWLQSVDACCVIVKLSRDLLDLSLSTKCKKPLNKNDAECIWKILQFCFGNLDDKPIVTLSCITQVLDIFQTALLETNSKDLTQLIEFSCELALSLFRSYPACWNLSGTEDLLLALFKISFQGVTSASLQDKVEDAWKIGMHHLLKAKGGFMNKGGFFDECTRYVNQWLVSQLKTKQAVKQFVRIVTKLVTSVYESVLSSEEEEHILSNDMVGLLLRNILPTGDQWKNLNAALSDVCLMHSAATGRFLFTRFPTADLKEFAKQFPTVIHPQLASLGIISMLQKHADSSTSVSTEHCLNLVEDYVTLTHLPQFLLAHGFCSGLSCDRPTQGIVQEESYSLKEVLNIFLDNLSHYMDALSIDKKVELLEFMFEKAKTEGHIWNLAFDSTLQIMKDANLIGECLKDEDDAFLCATIEDIQSLQCLIPYVADEYKTKLISNTINMLLCSEDYFSANGVLGYLSLLASALFHAKDTDLSSLRDDTLAVMEYLNSLKNNSPNYFACNKAITENNADVLVFCSHACCFMQTVLRHFPFSLSPDHWDFLLCSLTSWIECIGKHREHLKQNLSFVNLAYQCFTCLEVAGGILNELPSNPAKEEFPPNLYLEWTEFFTSRIYETTLPLYMYLTRFEYNQTQDMFLSSLMETIASTLKYASKTQILSLEFEAGKEEESAVKNVVCLPPNVNCLLRQFCPLLIHKNYAVQLGAHAVLRKIVADMPTMVTNEDGEGSEELPDTLAPPRGILNLLKETNIVVDTMLMEFRVGSCCIVQPYTDSYTYTLGYLLVWVHLSEFFSASSSEDRSRYAAFFQESGLLSSLLLNLFKLMPVINLVLLENNSKAAKEAIFFNELPSLDPRERPTSIHLLHLACQVYLMTLRKFPALVRQWWTGQDKVTADIVNKYTSKFVSSLICAEEIKAVQHSSKDFVNMSVITRPIAREVVATYSIDDATIELVIILPQNHPLGVITVESRKKVKVGNAQWRNWMLQLTTFLMHQNGSILDALSLWKRNIDKRFEGVEECMVCFSVLHGSTCQLPRLMCRTCKKKFHSFCLYKWFSTSNNTACPLCRNLF